MTKELPIPNAQEVEQFRGLFQERFSVELGPDEALLVATHYLQVFVILTSEA